MSDNKQKPVASAEKPVLRAILAGLSSICAQTVTHPIETVKARMQISGEEGRKSAGNYSGILSTIQSITKNEGVKGLYKGIQAAWAREIVYSSLRLGLYEPIKSLFKTDKNVALPFWKKLLSASSAGCIAAMCANPVDFLKIRMQNWEGASQGPMWHVRQVLADSGVLGFYRGVQITMIRAMIINGSKLSSYDQIKSYFKKTRGFKDGVQLQFACSFTAGFIMACCAAPFDLCRTRVFSQDSKNPKYRGLVHAFTSTVKHEGPLGLYKGFIPMWGRFGPFTVIQLISWEQLRKLCGISTL